MEFEIRKVDAEIEFEDFKKCRITVEGVGDTIVVRLGGDKERALNLFLTIITLVKLMQSGVVEAAFGREGGGDAGADAQ
jgi:hypothetical protein